MVATLLDLLDLAQLTLAERRIAAVGEQLGEADDGIQRGAQLMAHRRQEVALGAVGLLGLIACLGEFAGMAVEIDQQRAGGGKGLQPLHGALVVIVASVGNRVHADYLVTFENRHAEISV